MTEFTEEQKKEINLMLKKQSELEQFRICGDQFYRLSIGHITSLVNQGICDPFVLNVGKSLHSTFIKQTFGDTEPSPAPEHTGSADDETENS